MKKPRWSLALWTMLAVLLFMHGVQADHAAGLTCAKLEQMGYQIAKDVPAGIEPLTVGSLEDAQKLIRQLRSGRGKLEWSDEANHPTSPLQMATAIAIDVRTLHYSYVCNPVWRTRFNLWADVYVAASGSFHWIDEVRNVRVALSGLHPFIQLVDTYTDSYIYPNQQRTRIEGGGTLEYYLFIQGVLVYYSEPAYIIAYYSI